MVSFSTNLMWLQGLLQKARYHVCLSSCKSNNNLRNIITKGIPHLAILCRVVYALLRIYSTSCGTRKNLFDFCVFSLEGIATTS